MKIGLIDADSHNFPNIALMKLSAYHKLQGDRVGLYDGFTQYDRVYISKVFDMQYSSNMLLPANTDEIVMGGTGIDLKNKLPVAIEGICPDYRLFPKFTEAYGYLTRGCPRGCSFCVVAEKEGQCSRQVSDLDGFYRGQKEIKLLDPNLLACCEHERLLEQLANSKAYVDFTQGLDIRLVTPDNIVLLNRVKTKMIHFAWDNPRDDLIEGFQRFRQLSRIKDSRKLGVYVLTNYGSTHEQDLYRIYTLRSLGFDPFVMVYNKSTAPQITKDLQRWCNNRRIFKAVPDFTKYDPKLR